MVQGVNRSRPLDIILHFDYVPLEEDFDGGWTPQDIEAEVRDMLTRFIRNTSALELESIEVVEL